MSIKPNFHILARLCEDGSLDWKNHIHRSQKGAEEFRDKIDGEWEIFRLEPVKVEEVFIKEDGEYYVEPIPDDEMWHGN